MKILAHQIAIRRNQQGVALMVSLLILIGVTVISLAAINASVLGLRMAGNQEGIINTVQTAQSAIDFLVSDPSILPTNGPLNQPTVVNVTGSEFNYATVNTFATRISECLPPPRSSTFPSSMAAYSAFHFDLMADIDKTANGMSQSAMVQGVILLGPKC